MMHEARLPELKIAQGINDGPAQRPCSIFKEELKFVFLRVLAR